MLTQWMGLCAGAFVVFRIVSFIWVWIGTKAVPAPGLAKLIYELLAQAAAGAVVGIIIWSGLWLCLSHYGKQEFSSLDQVVVFGVPWFLTAFLAGQVLLAGLTSHLIPKSGDRDREWWARASGWYGAAALGWLFIAGVVIFGLQELRNVQTLILATTGSGAISSLLGTSPISGALGQALKGVQRSVSKVIALASIVFIFCLSVLITHYTVILLYDLSSWVAGLYPFEVPLAMQRLAWTFLAMLVLMGASLGASAFVNVNYFSLNALYRNRLVRAFLGASNSQARDRNPFNGFAETDNLAMCELHPNVNAGPFPVINMTLNLTATDNKAWQERKAASFISTPRRTGGHLVGYRPSTSYAGGGGITLGTAMSLSGAAVSPSWGYHSSTITSFIMAIFNVRLGQWLGNPKHATAWTKDGPRNGFRLFLQEALGHTTDKEPFVYLSDGGHFENLGLYEVIRRRCHTIVVSDAGADPDCTLEDLGNAIRKIFIDLRVAIDFERIDVRKREPDSAHRGVYCAVGRVTYPEDDAKEGRIIYIKPGLYDDVPADVRAYAAADAKFPHDTTLNQWFTESQFESYRALGAHTIEMITIQRDSSGNILDPQPSYPAIGGLRDFSARADAYLKGYRDRLGQAPDADVRRALVI
jgi:hypothetical protein